MMKAATTMIALMIVFTSFVPISIASESVDKVYHPYVLPFEREFEWRFSSRKSSSGTTLLQKFAYGHALNEYLTLEAYIVGERGENGHFGIDSYELETRWMLSDQGKYWADFGILIEVEKAHETDSWELTTGLLSEKEFGKTSLTVNLLMSQKWGSDTGERLQGKFALKYRYRWIPALQPAIEIYSDKDFLGAGPAFMGVKRFDRQQQLKWELGFIKGLNGSSNDHTLRFALEMEF